MIIAFLICLAIIALIVIVITDENIGARLSGGITLTSNVVKSSLGGEIDRNDRAIPIIT